MAATSPRTDSSQPGGPLDSASHHARADSRYAPQDDRALYAGGNPERTTSQRRRASAQNPESLDYRQILPAAPEVPQSSRTVPSTSYKEQYVSGEMHPARGPASDRSRSFAARAGMIPDEVDIQQPQSAIIEPQVATDRRGSRRGSIKQTATAGHSQVQAPVSPSYLPSTTNNTRTGQKDALSVNTRQEQRPPRLDTNAGSHNTSVPVGQSPSSVPARSATLKSPSRQTNEWAADRSPLQRLEVKLNDISKEEKRARVELAEQRLREAQGRTGARRASQPTGAPIRQVSTSKRAVSGPMADRRSTVAAVNEDATKSAGRETLYDRPPRRDQQYADNRRSQQNAGVSAIPNRTSSQRQSAASGIPSGRRRSTGQGQGDDRGVRFHHDLEDAGPAGSPAGSPAQLSRDGDSSTGAAITLPKSTRQQVLTRQGDLDYQGGSKEHIDLTPDPVPGHAVRSKQEGHKYQIPPQTAAGIETRKQVGFGSRLDERTDVPTHQHPHLSTILHHGRNRNSPGALQPPLSRHLSEWRAGGVARLTLADLQPAAAQSKADKKNTWWEKSNAAGSRKNRPDEYEPDNDTYDGYLEDQNFPTAFDPPLLLKCGPMIRYTGMRCEKFEQPNAIERETWRGSVMIVTSDEASSYDTVPSLRLFHQPMQLLPPPPPHFEGEEGEELEAEYVDPIGGLPRISRTGGTIYVKPVEDLEEGKDVSRIENDDGLYEETRTANVPTSYGKADELLGRSPHSPHPRNRAAQREGRQAGRYREVHGVRLHAERGVTFWRFNLEVELGDHQQRIAYRINRGASVGFWVPARGQSMNLMFHSCNGFSLSVDSNVFSGPDPLWRDVMNSHQIKPFHVMIGGGDQIYNDAVMRQTHLFQEWLELKNPRHKHGAPFSQEMRDELETFYLERYSMWFSQGLFGMANSQIPMINIWDDHDIIDGFGSYPHHFMSAPVFCGLGNIAFKYYMLFQHQSVVDETSSDEPSWLLGASPGPYINELSRSVFMFLGKSIAFLGLDCRTERMRDEILSEASYDMVFDRLHRELVKGETKHLLVLLGVPIAYPRLVWLENVLTSRALDPLKALGRMGMLGNLMNKFDGGVEILDDLDDHWTAKNHKEERNWFIEELQEIAAEKSVRVTILGGDVHLAAVGQFYSQKRLMIPKDRDFRYMANVISSAIVNTPPPDMMADVLNKRNKIHHLNADTDEDMIPMFTHDVDGKPRNNKHLLPKRNWCSITEYHPGSTPPPTPPSLSPTESQESLPQHQGPQQPSLIKRTLSLGRGDSKPAKLIRRLSQGGKDQPSPQGQITTQFNRPPPDDSPLSSPDAYTQPHPAPMAPGAPQYETAPIPTRPTNTFHRRPTNMSEKAAAKGGAVDEHVDLEYGLDVSLNCEIKQGDPSGSTEQYRLLVPALLYDGPLPEHKPRKQGIIKRLGSIRGNRNKHNAGESDSGSESHSEAESGSDISAEPGKGGIVRRLSNAFTRPTNLLHKQPPPQRAISAPQPFKPRPQVHPHRASPPVVLPPALKNRAQPDTQIPRSSPITAYAQHSPSYSGSPSQIPQRSPAGAATNAYARSPLQQTQHAHPLASAPVAHNRTAPLNYESDDVSDLEEGDEEIVKHSGNRFSRSGAEKFFGEDLPPNGGNVPNVPTMNGGGKAHRNSGGYSGIDAYQEGKKGWRKFF